MRQIPPLDMPSNVAKFWRSYVYVGVLIYSLGASAVLIMSAEKANHWEEPQTP